MINIRVVTLFSLCPFPDESVYVCQMWSRSIQWFGNFHRLMNWDPLTFHAPRWSRGNLFSSCPFPDEYYVCQIWSRSVQVFGIFPTSLNLQPPGPLQCPLGFDGLICLACVHSLVNLYTGAKFAPDRYSGLEAFPRFINCWPLTPHAPRVSMG